MDIKKFKEHDMIEPNERDGILLLKRVVYIHP